jgi:hypothetical protein
VELTPASGRQRAPFTDNHDTEHQGHPAARRMAAVVIRAHAPELALVHRWLDSWSGIGLVVVGMAHQGFQVCVGEHGAGQWIAVFYSGRDGHEPVTAAGTARAQTPWRAVQRAAWAAVGKAGG